MPFQNQLQRVALEGAELWLAPAWLPVDRADALLTHLRAHIPWNMHRIRMFGREIDSPRLSCWIGEPEAVYTYSRTRFMPRPWPPALREIRIDLQRVLGVDFNSVLANLYRDGRDRMGWHSDDEPELGPDPVIASVSLGATRRFALKPRQEGARLTLDLPHGSLLVMRGATQTRYLHALHATKRPVAERINLTFRNVLA